ncbi:ShlB/FhaC/HecB family hemolysin secretion/activation protein [Stutzerimonas kirkiae]|uniref:ShlB/FhaC/HecB family hemolysin secretion/activation protein n=2 Tax=Stutzerimonas kirkiae TaxID=2211392 RepID=A0A4Q9R7C9_9GAMM|nr:ShlB/FhaC/HecB family hemolysin secretion/activation protein [Stutzerimonas kirkiae]TBV03187.1 ShlB/FhaC/HecB family hemolysin secretion/activation protein [Stutzerimonas kirkiae]
MGKPRAPTYGSPHSPMRREQQCLRMPAKASYPTTPLHGRQCRVWQPGTAMPNNRHPGGASSRWISAFASAVLCSTAYAQIAPDAGQIQRQIEQELRTPDIQQPPKAVAPETVVDTSGPQVVIRRIELEGASLIPHDQLIRQFEPYLNRPISLGELQAAAQTLVGVYRERGWFVRVQLPEQDVSDGTLRVRVIEGHFGRIDLQPGDSRANAEFVANTVGRHLEAGQPYSLAALERGLLLANDLPGVRADGTLRAGQAQGTSDLALRVSDTPLISGALGASNYGNRFTGRGQGFASLALNGPSGYGDRLQLSGLLAEHLDYLGADYSLPLGHDGLRARLGYSQVHYRLGKDFAILDSKGETRTVRAGLDYPLLRSSQHNLWLGLEQAQARQEDETLGITLRERRLATTTLELRGDARDAWGGGGLNSGRLALSGGRADLRLAADRAQDAGGAGIDGDFAHLRLDLRRDQVLAPSLYLRGRFSSQLAFDNLDSSQQFSLGGPYGVRGYPVNEASGDSGALLQLELHSLLPWAGIPGLDGYAFLDGGVIRQRHTTWQGWDTADSGRNSYALYAAGLGLSWSHPRGFAINGVLATPLGNNPGSGESDHDQDGTRSGPRAWLSLSQAF